MLDLAGLNPPQRAAVEHGDGPLLVLAGAGSGKTRVITYRIASLLQRGVSGKQICALSFTNKAAAEMKERVEKLVGARAGGVTLCTFHALGLQMLKTEKKALGFPSGFTIYDQADQLGTVRELLREVKIDDRRFDPKAILHRISRAKNAGLDAEAYDPDPTDEYDEITAAIFPRYERAMRGFAAVDFDDLIGQPVRLLEDDPGVRQRWQERFSHLLVDEYQDTNGCQLTFLQALAEQHKNVTVVGDDDQSIYAFRGAVASNILEFEKHFAGAKVIKLEQNYRSTPTILEAANAVIRNNAARHGKELFSDRARGEPIALIASADAEAEAAFVVEELERIKLAEGRRWSDFAVLYRSNVQAKPLEEAFQLRKVPFELRGGQKFFERKEIKDTIAYLKAAVAPKDEIALRRIINYPARGIGSTTVEKVAAWAQEQKIPLGAAFARAEEIDGLTAAAKKAIAGFVALIGRVRDGIKAGSAVKTTETLVEEIRLYEDLRDAAPSTNAGQRRIDNVKDFLRSLGQHEERQGGTDKLREYLNFLTLDARDDDDEEDGDQVTLVTLHGAKGLEWPVVFLVGLEEELLPHARTINPNALDVDVGGDVSEERRLAYVGITRAREKLILTHARFRFRHGAARATIPSRFLAEIPEALLRKRDLLAEAAAPVEKTEIQNFFRNFLAD